MNNQIDDSQINPNNIAKIQTWLIIEIAQLLQVNPEQIDSYEPLDSYGLDSTQAIMIASKAEKIFGFKLSLIHLWYYPTIAELSQRLAEELEDSQSEIIQI